jgi:MFS family permease
LLAFLCPYVLHVFKFYNYYIVFLYTFLNTFRSFVGNRQDVKLLKYLAISHSAANGFGRPLWGILFDKFGFKKLFITLNACSILASATIYFVPEHKVLLSIYVPFTGLLTAGVFSMMPSFVSKIFGLRLSSEIYGFNFMAFGVAGILGPIFIYIVNNSGMATEGTYPYLFVYVLGAVLSLVSLIICIFTKDEKFEYD